MVAFLRFFSITILSRFGRFHQIMCTAHTWRMRGLALRIFRVLLSLDTVDRIVRGNRGKCLVRLKETLVTKQWKIETFWLEIDELKVSVWQQVPTLQKSAEALRRAVCACCDPV